MAREIKDEYMEWLMFLMKKTNSSEWYATQSAGTNPSLRTNTCHLPTAASAKRRFTQIDFSLLAATEESHVYMAY